MSTKNVLGIDMGASNGRAVVGRYNGKKLEIAELHRFNNVPVTLNAGYYWDVLSLFDQIKKSIAKSSDIKIDSVGIDTWGVDFGLIDENGYLLENPHHYRDPRTEGMPRKVFDKIPEYDIFAQTGMHPAQLTTLFQLAALRQNQENLLKTAETLLFMPDLFRFLLTGDRSSEHTIAATSLLFDPNTKEWIKNYLKEFEIPDILPKLENSG
ncbi:MAG: rhamnulokinase, partial [Candidatus Latescibacteria bacterium]|nr:rhamnulokinase [Candidatus Latescibacterota bacterium]